MIYPRNIEEKIGFTGIRREVEGLCLTASGREKVTDMRFLTNGETVSRLLKETSEMVKAMSADKPFPLDALPECKEILASLRLEGSWLSAAEFVKLRKMTSTCSEIEAFFKTPAEETPPYPNLKNVAASLENFADISRKIDVVVSPEGEVRDSASRLLADIRRSIASMGGCIEAAMRRVMRNAVAEGLIEPDAAPSMRDGRLVIPVSPMHKRKIQGIVHDESASGKTVFIEPAEVVEANNRLRELQLEEHREIARILTALSADIRPRLPELESAWDVLAEFDFIRGKALHAVNNNCQMPSFDPSRPEIDWYGAFHPVLRNALERQGKKIVNLDIRLDPHKSVLIVSGPNAGGKSVVLKTVATVQYFIQCGMLPPLAYNSHTGMFGSLFMDIGDDQSMEDDLSTYSSHLRNMKFLLSNANDRSLVLIDEFGSGTEPRIGGAIAEAILKKLIQKKIWGVITTHFQNLKEFAQKSEGVINGSMLYDRQRMKPLFKLSIGTPGSSFAIEIARLTGLPSDVLDEVELLVGKDYINLDRYLMDINRDKRYWENKRDAIRIKEKKLEALLEKYENDALDLRNERRHLIEEARKEAKGIIDSSNAAIERTILEIRREQAEKESTRQAREKLRAQSRRLAEPDSSTEDNEKVSKALKATKKLRKGKQRGEGVKPDEPQARPLAPGDNVLLDGTGTPGSILEIDGKKALVAFGHLKTTVSISRLKHTMKKASATPAGESFISRATMDGMREKQLNFSREVDVRGMRAAEAVQAITYFVDDAIQLGADRVRILHGTGSGALRQYIRQYLATIPEIDRYHDEDVRFGGAGITVIEFK